MSIEVTSQQEVMMMNNEFKTKTNVRKNGEYK